MADEFAEYIYGTKVRTSEDERVWELAPQSDRRERVVRCRDCEHGMGGGNLCSMFAFPLGDGHIIPADVKPDGFCAWGEPREASE